MNPVEVAVHATDGAGRWATATTARGGYTTPCFMPVGTRASVKYLSAADHESLGTEIVLANAYHLMLRPGAATVSRLGGIGRFTGWGGLTLTDSGGFQVFSLDPDVDDEGVSFRSVYDGSTHRLTPEAAVEIQELLGADIQMALDVCAPLPSPDAVLALAVERTVSWAKRARAAHRRPDQALFGIVQGGTSPTMRTDCARRVVDLDFDGYGIGGLSVGESRAEMVDALGVTIEQLPADRPRYLMGVGDPVSMVEAVSAGVDQFDCVMQTRLGRHGTAMTGEGKLHVKAARYATSDEPLDLACCCEVCGRHTRGYLRHLFSVGEPSAARLVSVHNVAWTLALMRRIAKAIEHRSLLSLRAELLSIWS